MGRLYSAWDQLAGLSKAIRAVDSSRTQWLTLSGARWRRLSSSFGLVTG